MRVNVIGGGLAGSECAYQLLKRGIEVTMYEMKGVKKSAAHTFDTLCELVCSNSLKSEDVNTSSGLLKAELDLLDCMVLRCARQCRVPAGNALAVDREKFSQMVTSELKKFANFTLVEKVVTDVVPVQGEINVVATGPLTDATLIPNLAQLLGKDFLYFYDAVAPIVTADSIDFSSAFFASRYNKGDADYINCPLNRAEFEHFWRELVGAETVEVKGFENNVFEGCMPIEVMAQRGEGTIRFGPLKPVGLVDDRTGTKNYAVLQLRKENAEGTLYNLVGFQTHLRFGEQKRVFSLIPALKNAEFVRYGVMHRNTYINSPKLLDRNFRLLSNKNIYFAGQLTGVEGYVESIASGLVAALAVYRQINGMPDIDFPPETIIGALSRHISTDFGNFIPMNSNFGILPPLPVQIKDKAKKKQMYAERSLAAMRSLVY
jgi:methylenetetrahydrofolate--tRNA-(uracil-5-)-methyltransferase